MKHYKIVVALMLLALHLGVICSHMDDQVEEVVHEIPMLQTSRRQDPIS